MGPPDGAGRVVDDALHLLAPRGCALCAAAHDGVEAWARAFVGEARADLDAVDAVRDALGFCPVHTRRMLADPAASWVLPTVAAEVVDEGRERLAGGLAGRRPGGVAVCPACVRAARSAQIGAGLLARALADPRVSAAFTAAGGVCAPHLVDLAADAAAGRDGATARRSASRVLLERLDRAGGRDGVTEPAGGPQALPGLLAALAGDDPDADRRAALVPVLAALATADDEAAAAGGGRARALVALSRPTCPLCTAAAVAAWRYVAWLVGAAGTPARGEPPARQDAVLCEVHLVDAVRVPGPRVGWLLAEAAAAARTVVARAADGPVARGRFRLGLRPPDPARGLGCRACSAAQTAHERTWALLDAVAADATLAEAARAAHGVCLRHGILTAAGHGPAGRLFGEILDGRLAMLGWDLREGLRLGRWDARFTPVGAEASAWRRATTLLDGRIDLGTPVP